MSTAVDPFRNLIIWGYPSTDLTYRLLIYHLITKKWSFADTNVSRIANLFTPAFTLEQLDSFSASLDALPDLFRRQAMGGWKVPFWRRYRDKIITFSGPNKEARITTADLETGGNMSMVTLAKPIVDGGSASVAVASRQNLAEAVSFNTAVAADSENRVGLRSLGRYHRLRVIPSGNWSTAIGVEMEIQPCGDALMQFRRLPPFGGDSRAVAEILNSVMDGKTNNTGTITLETGDATSTTLNDARISIDTKIILIPFSDAAEGDSPHSHSFQITTIRPLLR
jgi:hypothetical protein